jgi:hypothetical protein
MSRTSEEAYYCHVHWVSSTSEAIVYKNVHLVSRSTEEGILYLDLWYLILVFKLFGHALNAKSGKIQKRTEFGILNKYLHFGYVY